MSLLGRLGKLVRAFLLMTAVLVGVLLGERLAAGGMAELFSAQSLERQRPIAGACAFQTSRSLALEILFRVIQRSFDIDHLLLYGTLLQHKYEQYPNIVDRHKFQMLVATTNAPGSGRQSRGPRRLCQHCGAETQPLVNLRSCLTKLHADVAPFARGEFCFRR